MRVTTLFKRLLRLDGARVVAVRSDGLHWPHDDGLRWLHLPRRLLPSPVLEAPGLAAGLDDVSPVREPVDDRLRQARVGEDLRPLAEGEVGCHDQRRSLVALRDHLEDELGRPFGQSEVAELVDLCRHRHRSTYADTCSRIRVPLIFGSCGGAKPSASASAVAARQQQRVVHKRRNRRTPQSVPVRLTQ